MDEDRITITGEHNIEESMYYFEHPPAPRRRGGAGADIMDGHGSAHRIIFGWFILEKERISKLHALMRLTKK